MHYIDVDWFPPAIAMSVAALVIATLHALTWVGQRRARARTQRAIERVLSEHDRGDTA
jgi:hypothetical protein